MPAGHAGDPIRRRRARHIASCPRHAAPFLFAGRTTCHAYPPDRFAPALRVVCCQYYRRAVNASAGWMLLSEFLCYGIHAGEGSAKSLELVDQAL